MDAYKGICFFLIAIVGSALFFWQFITLILS